MATSGQVHPSGPGRVVPLGGRRRVWAAVLALPMVLSLTLGLLDPLEGGMALLVGLVLAALVWTLSRVPVPRWAGFTALAAVVLGAAALLWAGATPDDDGGRSWASGLVLGVFVVGYEVSVLATVVGGVIFAVRVIRQARPPRPAEPGGS
ncbi:hypothetical protein ACT8ZV_02850 [Nocardioides sp. MAHUQ-72]|uniref:hypothetical protein n=1 Tax=unclassified Nocardioides TaxID=2615069 RepID=UPI003606E0EC